MTTIPLHEVHSFPGSRDSLLLRCLSAHPRVEVVHDLFAKDDRRDLALVEFARASETTAIDVQAEALAHRALQPGSVLVLKAAPHSTRAKPGGLVYVRNPFDLMSTLGFTRPERLPAFNRNTERLGRWAMQVDPAMKRFVLDTDHLTAACALYQRSMLGVGRVGLPIVHHERLEADPEGVLRQVLGCMELEWDAGVLTAHQAFAEGDVGREMIRLWEPIGSAFEEAPEELDDATFDRIYALCAPTLDRYGYRVDGRQISVDPDFRIHRASGASADEAG